MFIPCSVIVPMRANHLQRPLCLYRMGKIACRRVENPGSFALTVLFAALKVLGPWRSSSWNAQDFPRIHLADDKAMF